ncbi:hypothetical protein QZM22_19220 [Burkholderia oklahomensis]|uniref:hypothetical protein n=1 Tax=Burkholderia oklahomensis TaxID=342113 RepID=UPI002653579D|nr:hypothetical protein [Burkholderia oklahomensis]MDN7674599.1 hypothetical protein [Burkholderia oklahomensis]
MNRPALVGAARAYAAVRLLLRRASRVAALATCGVALCAHAAELQLSGYYQRPDGAITVRLNGAGIDPYFAAKALLGAADAQLDARQAARAWIAWLLPRQRADGGFDRFCVKDNQYAACADADADDSMMATWMELLVRFAPPSGMPANWARSLARASAHLDTLLDKRTGVYQISPTLHVALLMDNVEVHSALQALAEYYIRRSDYAHAGPWSHRADRLSAAILQVFWRGTQSGFRASTQQIGDSSFYPEKVAQIFPILSGIRVPDQSNETVYAQWMHRYGKTWLQLAGTDFPWGLIALIAYKMNDWNTVACWHARSGPYRHGPHWNVLEEALYLAFESRMADPVAPARCGFTTASAAAVLR